MTNYNVETTMAEGLHRAGEDMIFSRRKIGDIFNQLRENDSKEMISENPKLYLNKVNSKYRSLRRETTSNHNSGNLMDQAVEEAVTETERELSSYPERIQAAESLHRVGENLGGDRDDIAEVFNWLDSRPSVRMGIIRDMPKNTLETYGDKVLNKEDQYPNVAYKFDDSNW